MAHAAKNSVLLGQGNWIGYDFYMTVTRSFKPHLTQVMSPKG